LAWLPPWTGTGARVERCCPWRADWTTALSNSEPEPVWVWPTWMGSMVRGEPRNAANNESDSTRYFPAFTEDMAYITTKNASNSVTRSP